MKTVGLIGLGNAGGPVAERLLQTDYRLKVFDLSSETVEAFERRGAIRAGSAAEAASEITVILLPSAVEVRAAVYGDRGVLTGMKPGNVLIDLSGTDPACARELEEAVMTQGGRFLGGTVHAAGAPAITIPQGKFSIVIGGKKDTLDDSIEVLICLARKIICVPEPWIPKSIKLAIIMLATIESVATAEIMAWLLGQEIEPRMFRDILRGLRRLHMDGLSGVTVDNSQNDSDVFVKLVSLDGSQAYPVRAFFIPAHGRFTLNKITAGNYDVRYRDLSTGRLSRSEAFKLEEIPINNGIQYSKMTMTLYRVPEGNMQTYELSEMEFEDPRSQSRDIFDELAEKNQRKGSTDKVFK